MVRPGLTAPPENEKAPSRGPFLFPAENALWTWRRYTDDRKCGREDIFRVAIGRLRRQQRKVRSGKPERVFTRVRTVIGQRILYYKISACVLITGEFESIRRIDWSISIKA